VEIRRIEPEVIKPPPASERTARVPDATRQHRQSPRDDGQQHPTPEHDTPSDDETTEPPAAPTTYQADGHVHGPEAPAGETHHIDYTA